MNWRYSVGVHVRFTVDELNGASVIYSVGKGPKLRGEIVAQPSVAGRVKIEILGPVLIRRRSQGDRVTRPLLRLRQSDADKIRRGAKGEGAAFICQGLEDQGQR